MRTTTRNPARLGLNSWSSTKTALCGFLAVQAAACARGTVWTVTSLLDSGAGSLRQQVASSASGDTIQFAVSGTILLSSSIKISHTLTVQGPGPAGLTVDAGGVDRAFTTAGNPVILSGMTVRNGRVVGPPGADGGVGQNGSPGFDAYGGAILDSGPSIILSNCWFDHNTVQGGPGGRGGDADYPFTPPPGNGGEGGLASGGAYCAVSSIATMINCTFSHNFAIAGAGGNGGTNDGTGALGGTGGGGGGGEGGACLFVSGLVTNCTFSANGAFGSPGGKGGDPMGTGGGGGTGEAGAVYSGALSLVGCTIVSNSAFAGAGGAGGNSGGASGSPGTGMAGGVEAYLLGGCNIPIGNTILAENHADTSQPNYAAKFLDMGYNFIGTWDNNVCPFGSLSRTGSVASPLHPLLGPLAENGSGLPTHLPLYPGAVVDQGYSFGLTADERGAPRPYVFGLSEPPGGDGSDIGAVELGTGPMGMNRIGTNVLLSWPAYYGNFSLQFTTNPGATNSWVYVPDSPVLISNQFIVTNSVASPMQFYRLIGSSPPPTTGAP